MGLMGRTNVKTRPQFGFTMCCPDGTPYREQEAEILRELTGKTTVANR